MIVSNFLKQQAHLNKLTIFDTIYGDMSISHSQSSMTQSSGSTYGIWVELNDSTIKNALIADLVKCGKKVNPKSTAIYSNWYPLYWGKDINPGSRIKAHFKASSSTNALNLSQLNLSQNYNFKYGLILVSDYSNFESFLHENYPTIISNSYTPGKGSAISILY